MSDKKWFKAQSAAERSGDILVSFDARWRDSMSSGRIHYVLRRRYPKSFRPHRMYLYIGSPHSQLIGFTSINEVRPINFKEGLRILVASGLTRRELASYFSGYEKVGCYVISSVAVFKQPLALEILRARSGFVPPKALLRFRNGRPNGSRNKSWSSRPATTEAIDQTEGPGLTAMGKQFDKLAALLGTLFQLDQPDLDFGLYRIMHAKAARSHSSSRKTCYRRSMKPSATTPQPTRPLLKTS